MDTPLVSVLMTSYNREDYIGEAIESVLKSTYQNFELIIVDDGSSDNTVEIIKASAKEDKRIRFYQNEINLGDYRNRNMAATYAKGAFIKYFDSDDVLYPWGLGYCVDLMEKYPNAGMGIFKASNKITKEYILPEESIRYHFFTSNFLNIGPSGTILRTAAFKEVGYFTASYGPASDMYFNLKIASLYPVVILEKEFFYYRVHSGQEANNYTAYFLYNYPYMKDILKLETLPLNNEEKKELDNIAKVRFLKECFKNLKKLKFKETRKAFAYSKITLLEVFSLLKYKFVK